MGRTILTVNATQVVTSQTNPMGIKSVVSGYPKDFDSKDYNGDLEQTMRNAKSAYYAQLSANYANNNENRIMMTVTLSAVDGKQILCECIGGLEIDESAETNEPEA